MLRYVRQFHREIRPRIFHPVAYFAILCPIFLAEKVYTNDITNCLVSCVCMSARDSPLQRNNRNKKQTLDAKRLVIRINGINKRDDFEILSTLKRKFSPSPSLNFEKAAYPASELRLSRNHGKSVRFPSLPPSFVLTKEHWDRSRGPRSEGETTSVNPMSTFSFQVTSRGVFSRTAPKWPRTRRRTGIWAWLPTVPWCSSWRTRIWRRTTSATSCSGGWGSCAGRGSLPCACSACRQSRSSCWFTVSEENSTAGHQSFQPLKYFHRSWFNLLRVVSIQITFPFSN